ncbi:hypothetical protein [Clostridium thailandense]|uniref:hypothetical protein n=1 Tax=Clostridium thailandense TaxID=2794346 RepID=UPI003988E2C8
MNFAIERPPPKYSLTVVVTTGLYTTNPESSIACIHSLTLSKHIVRIQDIPTTLGLY